MDIPVSYFSVVELPKYSFNLDSYTAGNPWKKTAIQCITNTFVDLFLNKVINFKLVEPEKRILFNSIVWKLSEYEITTNLTSQSKYPFPWLESKIIDSISNSSQKSNLKDAIKILINSILPENNYYTNPSKHLIAEIIINSNTSLWTFETKGYTLNRKEHISKLKLNLPSKNRGLIKMEMSKFEALLNNPKVINSTTNWRLTISRLTRKMIASKEDLN